MDVYNQPFFPSAYNPFWGGMQLGMDGYNQPYVGPMPPYMGYTPGIFDAPSEGFFPQDTFGAGDHGYMTSFIPMRYVYFLYFDNFSIRELFWTWAYYYYYYFLLYWRLELMHPHTTPCP